MSIADRAAAATISHTPSWISSGGRSSQRWAWDSSVAVLRQLVISLRMATAMGHGQKACLIAPTVRRCRASGCAASPGWRFPFAGARLGGGVVVSARSVDAVVDQPPECLLVLGLPLSPPEHTQSRLQLDQGLCLVGGRRCLPQWRSGCSGGGSAAGRLACRPVGAGWRL